VADVADAEAEVGREARSGFGEGDGGVSGVDGESMALGMVFGNLRANKRCDDR
jgi:hypothetical protein